MTSSVRSRTFFDQRGLPTIERRGVPRAGLVELLSKDAYHFTRTAPLWRIVTLFAAIFVGTNLLFASVLWLGDAQIINAGPDFIDRFWFSVQTMATIGYGYLAPGDTLANLVVTVESFFGILITATATGVFFARFGTPQVRIVFSRHAVICDHEGVPTLMFRMANMRSTAIVEANVRVYLTRDEVLASGEQVRRIHDLALRRDTSPIFALSWTVYHPLDARSPLAGATPESLAATNGNILVTFTGIDDRLATTVHTRYGYDVTEIRFDHRLVDILRTDPQTSRRYLDYGHFHDIEPVAVVAPT